MKKFLNEFKEFAIKGNAMQLAVGVIIGGAFTAIVNALVENVLTPILGLFTGGWDFNTLSFGIGNAQIAYGAFISAVINFILIAFVLFLLVKAINKLNRKKEEAPAAPTTKVCPFCKSEINIEATRCPHCTSELNEERTDNETL